MSRRFELWHAPGARSLRVLWTLEELGLGDAVDIHQLRFPARVHHPEYLAVNALGSIPFFRDGEVCLSESMAICEYLAAKHGDAVAVEPAEAGYAAYRQYCYFGEATLMPPLGTLVRQLMFEPIERRSAQLVEDARQLFRARQAVLAEVLRRGETLSADRFTLADVSVGYALSLAASLGERGLFAPEVANYFERLTQRPAYQRATTSVRYRDPNIQ
jgi:glutathione S-transferase